MKKIVSIFLVLFVLSCAQVEKSVEPDTLFTQDKMAAVITDLYILEGAISSNKKAFLKTGVQPSDFLFTKHNMDSISFQQNLNYYIDRVEEYAIILDQVQSNLEVLQDSVEARQEREKEEDQKDIPKNSLEDYEVEINKPKLLKKS